MKRARPLDVGPAVSTLTRPALGALLLTACVQVPLQDSSAGDAGGSPSAQDAAGDEHDHTHSDHTHDEPTEEDHEHPLIELDLLAAGRDARDASAWASLPSLELTVVKDPVTGWLVHSSLTNFHLAPEESSDEHREGRGHLHLYVDDQMFAHVYGEFFYLSDLSVGEHRVRMEVVSNDHRVLASGENIIGVAWTVEQPDPDAPVRYHQRHEDSTLNLTSDTPPTVLLKLHADPEVGHLLEIQTEAFSVEPLSVSSDHINGEGHFRLAIDGEDRGRAFSNWLQLPELEPGDHTLSVELMTNDHRVYTANGEPIGASLQVGAAP